MQVSRQKQAKDMASELRDHLGERVVVWADVPAEVFRVQRANGEAIAVAFDLVDDMGAAVAGALATLVGGNGSERRE